jgi:hypothetical protein
MKMHSLAHIQTIWGCYMVVSPYIHNKYTHSQLYVDIQVRWIKHVNHNVCIRSTGREIYIHADAYNIETQSYNSMLTI